jgi:hypothetical protein
MDHVPKKYWTAATRGSTLGIHRGGAPSDAADRTLKIDVTRAEVDLTEILRGKVVRRVLLALSRFGPRLSKVTVRLAEPPNPLGGVDQRCRMRAWLQGTDAIHSEAINGGFETAVTRAAAQLATRMDFALDGDGHDGARPTARRGSASEAQLPKGSRHCIRPK